MKRKILLLIAIIPLFLASLFLWQNFGKDVLASTALIFVAGVEDDEETYGVFIDGDFYRAFDSSSDKELTIVADDGTGDWQTYRLEDFIPPEVINLDYRHLNYCWSDYPRVEFSWEYRGHIAQDGYELEITGPGVSIKREVDGMNRCDEQVGGRCVNENTHILVPTSEELQNDNFINFDEKYTWSVIVSDVNGTWSSKAYSELITLPEHPRPQFSFSPTNPYAGADVAFFNETSDDDIGDMGSYGQGDRRAQEWKWEFEGGEPSSVTQDTRTSTRTSFKEDGEAEATLKAIWGDVNDGDYCKITTGTRGIDSLNVRSRLPGWDPEDPYIDPW